MTLVHNERTKLLANSLDRLSTACVAAGFIAPAVSLSSGSMSFSITLPTAISTMAWLSRRFDITFERKTCSWRADLMNAPTFFFLYILPFVIAGVGWVAVLLNERSNRAKIRIQSGK